jgi:hypothetical protein
MPSKPARKPLGTLLKKAASEAPAAPRTRPAAEQPPLVVRSLSLTPAASTALDSLIEAASARTGRKISASAVVRALLRVADQRGLASQVLAQVEAELNSGEVRWGRPR